MNMIMRTGDELTCENGHRIALASCDITERSGLRPEYFQWLVDPSAQFGPDVCPTCGADYIRLYRGSGPGYQPHTPKGWVDWKSLITLQRKDTDRAE